MLAFEIFVLIFVTESFRTFAFIQDGIIHVEKAVEHFNSFGNTSWKAHHNNLPTHIPLSHLKSQLGVLPEKKEYSYDEHHHPHSELPVNYDCRKAFPQCSSIFSIVDQSNCESCWAISTAAVLSDRFCIQSNGKINVTLSSANLLSCNKDNDGCGGGVMAEAWKYVKEHGLVTGGGYGSFEGCQPYPIAPKSDIRHREDIPQAFTPKCHKDHCSNKRYGLRKERTYKTSKTIRVPCDEEKIRREIYHHGSVTAGMQIFLSFLFYNTGIYKSHANEELVGLHAVRLIGWGEEFGVRYWIGANSWGRHWGENGFFKILRGRDHCGIESMVHAGQPIIDEHLKSKAPK